MNEIEYLNWLIVDTVKKYPDLKWFMDCVVDSLHELSIEDIHYYYANECADWDVLKYCAYRSVPLNVEYTTPFIAAVFIQLSNQDTNKITN